MLSEGYRQHEWSVGRRDDSSWRLTSGKREKGKGVSPVAPVRLAVTRLARLARPSLGAWARGRAGWKQSPECS